MKRSLLAAALPVVFGLIWGNCSAAGSDAPAAVVLPAPLSRQAIPPHRPDRVMLLSVTRAGNRLVAVGEHGAISLSDDSGVSWRAARSVPVDITLTKVRFANSKTGWAIGHMGVVLRTDDGGDTWVKQLDGAQGPLIAEGVVGPHEGSRWDTVQRLIADGPDKPLLDLLVEDVDTVTVVGAFNIAYRSTDGGAHWQYISDSLPNSQGYHLYGAEKDGPSETVVGEAGLILRRSVPEGPFEPVKSPYGGTMLGLISIGGGRLLAYGLRGNVLTTDSEGLEWQTTKLDNGEATINCGWVLQGNVLLGDQSGRLYASSDQGAHFHVAAALGAPITGIVSAPDGTTVVTTLIGALRLPAGTSVAKSSKGN